MANEQRRKEYEICKQRGHESSGVTLMSNPPLMVCKHCGTQYRFESKLIEQNVPEE